MYFFFSKVLLVFIFPCTWIILALLISLISKNKKYRYRSLVTAIVLLLIFTNPFLFNQFAHSWDVAPYKPGNKKYSCAIILGGFSIAAKGNEGNFSIAADRFLQGVKLLSTKQTSHLLITGGNGSLLAGAFREAPWAKKKLLEFNIPDSLILVEGASKNTTENAKFSKSLLEKSKLPPPYLLVTSAFHMRRSLMIFKKAGIEVVPYPANYMANSDVNAGDFVPSAEPLFYWTFYIKEVVGYVANSI